MRFGTTFPNVSDVAARDGEHQHTFKARPRNVLSLRTRASVTRLGSLNSTYANLPYRISHPSLAGGKRVCMSRNKGEIVVQNEQQKAKLLNPPLWMTRELVQQDRDAIDRSRTGREVCLNLFGRRTVVDVADEDAAGINVLSVFAHAALLSGL